eukprot:gene4795-3439_t
MHLMGLEGPWDDLPEAQRILAQLPLRYGGFGLRSQTEVAVYAQDCVGENTHRTVSAQKALHQSKLLSTLLTEPELTLVRAHKASGANRILTDPTPDIPDAAFRMYAAQRLGAPIVPMGTPCPCGALATNAHINTCPTAQRVPHQRRHDRLTGVVCEWATSLGYTTRTETRADPGRKRFDAELVSGSAHYATDVTVRYPVGGRGHRADDAMKEKQRQYTQQTTGTGITFTPLVLESIITEDVPWVGYGEVAVSHTEESFNGRQVGTVREKATGMCASRYCRKLLCPAASWCTYSGLSSLVRDHSCAGGLVQSSQTFDVLIDGLYLEVILPYEVFRQGLLAP